MAEARLERKEKFKPEDMVFNDQVELRRCGSLSKPGGRVSWTEEDQMTCDVGTPTRVFIGLTLALAMVVAWPGENRQTVWAQEDLNELFFRVTDATSGALVTDMTPEEFVVTQEGVPCEVVSAELVATRLQLVVLLDDSVGMTRFRQNMLNGMPGFFDALPEGSEVSLITMGAMGWFRWARTSSKRRIRLISAT